MSYTLYGSPTNGRVRACLLVAKSEGIDIKVAEKGADHLQKFPQGRGQIPALSGPGIDLTETVAICLYLASLNNNKSKVLGQTKEDAALVTQWITLANCELASTYVAWTGHLWEAPNTKPYNKPVAAAAEEKALAILDAIEKVLHTRTFLVGDRITMADNNFALCLFFPLKLVLDASWRATHPNVMRHFNTVINQKLFQSVVTDKPVLVEKKVEYVAPKKEKAPAAPAAPKAEKKKAPAKKEDDEDDVPTHEEPKAKHPCEALGPAKCFPLDEWKRQYSNLEFPKAMEWLESNLDESEYSFWKVAYKYDDELTQVFMSANLIGGLHSRLEASRKYLFGSAGVYGKANASKIQGAYMLRGNNFKDVFDVAPDWESYTFEKLDFKKDAEFIRGCWNWDNTYDGLEYADGKVFK